jgi:hypothetical protein
MATTKIINSLKNPKPQITIEELEAALTQIKAQGGQPTAVILLEGASGWESVKATNVVFDDKKQTVHIY